MTSCFHFHFSPLKPESVRCGGCWLPLLPTDAVDACCCSGGGCGEPLGAAFKTVPQTVPLGAAAATAGAGEPGGTCGGGGGAPEL